MNTPGSHKWRAAARRAADAVKRAFNPEVPDYASVERANKEKLRLALHERETAALERIAPFAGRIVLITDYGPMQRTPPEEMSRLELDLDAAGLLRRDAFGLALYMDSRRTTAGRKAQFQTYQSLGSMLAAYNKKVYTSQRDGTPMARHELLELIATDAEETTRAAEQDLGVQPQEVGHLAVVFAMDLFQMHLTPDVPYHAESFAITGVAPNQEPPLILSRISSDPFRSRNSNI